MKVHETGYGAPVGAHRRCQSHRTNAEPARQERTLRAQPVMAARSSGEHGDRPREGAPEWGALWSERIALGRMEGKADGVQGPAGSRPGGATAKHTGHHRGLSAGPVIKGGTRALGSASRRLDTSARKRRGTGGPRALARTCGVRPAASRRRDTTGGSRPGLAPPAPREAGREGRRAVVVEQRTASRPAQRRPRTWGTKAQGTHGREGDTGQNVGGRARQASP
jgi:hypothetical protein